MSAVVAVAGGDTSAFWRELDARIREQIQAGTFPVRLKTEDWNSGEINWLLDVVAPDQRTTTNVIANFRQVVKEGSLRLHPIVTRLVDLLSNSSPKGGSVQLTIDPEAQTAMYDGLMR